MKAFKTKISTFAMSIIVSSIVLFSCSKKDEPVPAPVVYPEQNPLTGYLAATGFDQKTTNFINGSDYELGYSFIPLVNGKMTAIVVKIPEARLGMRVTVWDKVAGTAIRTEIFDVQTANVEATKSITGLDLIKDKEYLISMNSNDWYKRSKTNDSSVTYPFTVGDIKITSYSYKNGTAQTIPDFQASAFYSGDCSFKFQK